MIQVLKEHEFLRRVEELLDQPKSSSELVEELLYLADQTYFDFLDAKQIRQNLKRLEKCKGALVTYLKRLVQRYLEPSQAFDSWIQKAQSEGIIVASP